MTHHHSINRQERFVHAKRVPKSELRSSTGFGMDVTNSCENLKWFTVHQAFLLVTINFFRGTHTCTVYSPLQDFIDFLPCRNSCLYFYDDIRAVSAVSKHGEPVHNTSTPHHRHTQKHFNGNGCAPHQFPNELCSIFVLATQNMNWI